METLDTSRTVGALLTERPSRGRVFEKYAIDYCCGGKRSLRDACAAGGLELDEVARALTVHDLADDSPAADWATLSPGPLADHIEAVHHTWLKLEIPRLSALVEKVARVHGERHPELAEVRRITREMFAELETHMLKEEQVLFPAIRQLDQTGRVEGFHCGSLLAPIRVMEHEHDSAGEALRQLRALTGDYTPPADGCGTFRVMLDGLREFEADLHLHVHKENNLLFPKAAALASAGECRL